MPQITEAEWKKQLEKDALEGLYFVYGPEKYLVQRSAARVKEKALQGTFPDFNLQEFDGMECAVDALAEAVEALPFMQRKWRSFTAAWKMCRKARFCFSISPA